MSATGSFIWYELMTSDATAAAKFYGAVVGWKIADRPDPLGGDMDYRMIGRSDGGYNGGVLLLTADMVRHGTRPAWLGYLDVSDVDDGEDHRSRWRQAADAAQGSAHGRHCDGRRPHGRALLRNGADSAAGKARREERRV